MLTQSQLTTLKAAINTNTASYPGAVASLNGEVIAAFFNAASATQVWATAVDVQAIYDAIDWTKFTPTDAADNTATFTNRALVIQTKQMNLQNMLQGRTKIDAAKLNIRTGLRDAVILLPSGALGAPASAGGASGVTLMTALVRFATVAEALFTNTQTTLGGVTASLMGFEGTLAGQDCVDALVMG